MIASVVVIFFLLLFTHHRQTPYSTQSSGSKGIAGDHGVTTATHLPIHDTIGTTTTTTTTFPHESSSSSSNSSSSSHPHADTVEPKMVYLLTYPSSGASFLVHLFQSLANTNTASMIGSYYLSYQVDTSKQTSTTKSKIVEEIYLPPVSIYSANLSLGPFWVLDPRSSASVTAHTILTETHCSGAYESPYTHQDYIQSIFSFEQACRTLFIKAPPMEKNISTTTRRNLQPGASISPSNTSSAGSISIGMDMKQIGIVDPSLVTRAIHLIRDPFSNIVSRFHVSRRFYYSSNQDMMNATIQGTLDSSGKSYNKNTTITTASVSSVNSDGNTLDSWLTQHPDTSEGLHTWCNDMNADLPSKDDLNNDTWSHYLPTWETISTLMQTVPCSLEVFKYVMWHNHALELSSMYLDSPSYVVYFEDLQNSEDRIQIVHDMVSFLNMTMSKASTSKGGFREEDFFMDRVWYRDRYFSEDERKNMELLIRKVAFPRTLKLLERYF